VNCRFPTVKAAVASYVQEVKLLANQLENLIRERDKLRLDIQVHYMTFSLFLLQNVVGIFIDTLFITTILQLELR
jgi:hypothetical protein